MGNSIFDQLKKSGLVNKSQAHNVRTEKQRQIKQKQKPKTAEETAQAVEQARLEKLERDRQLNAERRAETDRKQLTGQIKQMINTHRPKKVQQQLSKGQLAIARFNDGYELIPIIVANKILARDPEWFITRSAPVETAGEDDPYKDYKIPDDLMW